MEARSKAIVVVSVFLFAATLIATVVAVALLFPGTVLDRMWDLNKPAELPFRTIGRASGMILLLLGAATFSAAIGLRRRKRWAWWIAVALFSINGSGDAVSLIVTRDWIRSAAGMIVAALFLFALLRNRAEFTL